MPKIQGVNHRRAVRALEKAGFYVARDRGVDHLRDWDAWQQYDRRLDRLQDDVSEIEEFGKSGLSGRVRRYG